MNLQGIITRTVPPAAWAEGDNIPWSDSAFSRRMLAEHLTQEHDLASRRFDIIDRQVRWIHEEVLGCIPTRILELTCGPGLYTSRLARLGHECVGIDYAPAPIQYAREAATRENLACSYRQEDVREADYGEGFGMVMMLYGQLNVFRRTDVRRILGRAYSALAADGLLLLEPQRFATVENTGRAGSSWYSRGEGGGLFSEQPHLCLSESFWDSERQSATQRFFIVDADTNEVTRHALTNEAYTDGQFHELLTQAGFRDIRFYPSLVGVEVEEDGQSAFLAITGSK
jgi:SAM-dependent methyltransferase